MKFITLKNSIFAVDQIIAIHPIATPLALVVATHQHPNGVCITYGTKEELNSDLTHVSKVLGRITK